MNIKITLTLLVVLLVAETTPVAMAAATKDPFYSGFDHGCSDAKGGNYINTPGHGPSFHTAEFMRGYHQGFDTCSGKAGLVDGTSTNTQSQSQSTANNNDNSARQTVIINNK